MRERELPEKLSLDAKKRTYPELGEKVGRNRQLVKEYLDGVTVNRLSKKYDISLQRVYSILNMYRRED